MENVVSCMLCLGLVCQVVGLISIIKLSKQNKVEQEYTVVEAYEKQIKELLGIK